MGTRKCDVQEGAFPSLSVTHCYRVFGLIDCSLKGYYALVGRNSNVMLELQTLHPMHGRKPKPSPSNRYLWR